MPAIDFSEVQDLEPVEAGKYQAEIVQADEGTAKNSGYPKMDIRWKIIEGKYEGRLVFDTVSFHPKALWRTKALLLALEFPKNFSGELIPEMLLGKVATITVKIDTGRMDEATGEAYPDRNRVMKVGPASLSFTELASK